MAISILLEVFKMILSKVITLKGSIINPQAPTPPYLQTYVPEIQLQSQHQKEDFYS